MAQEHHTAAAMASFIGVQRCRLPGLKPSKPSAQHAPLSHAKATTRPQQWLKSTPRPQQWLLIGVQGCRLPGLKPSIPSKTLQGLQKSGQLRREQVPQQAQHAPLSHAKATTRPQQWLKSTPRPQQWLFYRRSRLPFPRPQTLPLQTLQTLQESGQLRREKVPQQAQHAPLSHAKATTRPQQWLKSTPRPQQWLFYRRSRLPFARPQTLHTLQNPPNPPKVRPAPQGTGTPTSPTCATLARKSHHKATAMAQGHPTAAAMASYFLYAFKAAVCQASNPPNPPKPSKPSKTLQTLQKSGQLRREKVPQQAQHAPLPHAKATTRPQQWLKGTPRPQQCLLIRVQGCRLPGLKPSKPSKTLQTLQNPPNPPKVRPAPQGKGTPTSPTRATPARKSHHKATAMAQEHHTTAAMALL